MGWTAPTTAVAGTPYAAARYNAELGGNLNWLANDHPRCRVSRTTNQSYGTGTDTAVVWSTGNATEFFDVGPMHDLVTNPSRLTVPTGGDGVYSITGYYEMDGSTATRYVSQLRVNGATVVAKAITMIPAPSSGASCSLAALVNLVATDYVEMTINQNSGGSINLTVGIAAMNWVAF